MSIPGKGKGATPDWLPKANSKSKTMFVTGATNISIFKLNNNYMDHKDDQLIIFNFKVQVVQVKLLFVVLPVKAAR